MPSNLAIDDGLLAKALRVGGRRTKRETVNEALAEYVQRRRRRRFAKLFGRSTSDPTGTDGDFSGLAKIEALRLF